MAKGIKRKLKKAQERVGREIATNSNGGLYARGLAGEGYAGGYSAAISDIMLLLDGCPPCVRPEYWSDYGEL